MPRRVPDISKICALTGFQPTIPLDQIIESVVESLRSSLGVSEAERRVPAPHLIETERDRAR